MVVTLLRKEMHSISVEEALAFRTPMRVVAIRYYKERSNVCAFPICPQCNLTMEREYQSFCDRCGQALDWKGFSRALVIMPKTR